MLSVEVPAPLKVAITGIDGAGKSTTLAILVEDLKQDNRIAKATNRPVYSVVDGKKEYHYRRLISLIDIMHGLADHTHNPNYVCAVNAIHVVLQGRVIEPTLIHRVQPTIVLGARDLLVDPAVYAVCYSPQLAHKGMPERIDFMERLTGVSYRDIIFFLTVPPEEAVARIERRIETESSSIEAVERPKWRHMHENAYQLGLLQREYFEALNEVQKRSKAEIVQIETSGKPQIEISSFIANIIRKKQVEAGLYCTVTEPVKEGFKWS